MPSNLQISDYITIIGILLTLILAFLNYWVKKRKKQTKLFKCKWVRAYNLKPEYLLDPTRPYNKYYPRDIDDEIRELVIQKKSILVTGQPLAGKTRTIYEVLKNIDETFDIIIPRPVAIDYEDYPFPHNITIIPKIIILDDFDIFVNISNFERLKEIIEKNNLIVIATCQSGDKYAILKTKFPIAAFFDDNIIDIGTIQNDEAKNIAEIENIEWEKTEFDGTIGSIFVDVHEKRKRYRELSHIERDILKTIKKLQISGIYEGNHIFPYEWIETAFKENYPDTKFHWGHVLTPLKNSELVSTPKDEEKKVHVEEVYLEKIVEFAEQLSELTILNEMLSIFSGNPDVLKRIADRALSLALIGVDKRDFAKTAIKAYEEARKIYGPDNVQMDYAQTLNDLGNAYQQLAKVENRKGNLTEAIKEYEEALEIFKPDKLPLYYASTQKNLGTAYRNLSEVEDTKDNLTKAIKAYEEARKIYGPDNVQMDYAITLSNLGTAYQELAKVENRKDNLTKAIKAYEEARKIYGPDNVQMDYAITLNNLGTAYRNLFEVEGKKDNLNEAFKAYEEVLKIFTPDKLPLYYAGTQNNLGTAYQQLAKVEHKKENLTKAIEAHGTALKIFIPEKLPLYYAQTLNYLGTAYQQLASVEHKKDNLKKAIQAYEAALEIFEREKMEYDAEPLRQSIPILQAELQES